MSVLQNYQFEQEEVQKIDYALYHEGLTVLKAVAYDYVRDKFFNFEHDLNVFKSDDPNLSHIVFVEALLDKETQTVLTLSYSKTGYTRKGEKRIFGISSLNVDPTCYGEEKGNSKELLNFNKFSIIDAESPSNGKVNLITIVDDEPKSLITTPSPYDYEIGSSCRTWVGAFPKGTIVRQATNPLAFGAIGENVLEKAREFDDHRPLAIQKTKQRDIQNI